MWEYKYVYTELDKKDLEDTLNAFGADNWEAVSVFPFTDEGMIMLLIIFKRKLGK